MSWIQRYKVRSYLGNSIWILPAIGMVTAVVLANGLHWIEARAGWQTDFNPDAARSLFGTLAGAMFTFIVFLASILLLVVQMASAQLTPRIIGFVFQDRVTRFALTLFGFTFTFTLCVLLRIHSVVPAVTTHLAAYLCLLSLGAFLFLIDHVGKSLRPSGALRGVASQGHVVIRSVYPQLHSAPPVPGHHFGELPHGELTLLHRSVGRSFPEPEDQALADVSDLQGVGGTHSGGQGLGRPSEAHDSPAEAPFKGQA